MRFRTMRQFIDSGEADREGSPEFEAEVERDAALAQQLEQVIRARLLLPFYAQHPDTDWTCTVPALLRVAAVEVMAACPGTTPDDFAEMARELAKTVEADAKEIAKRARNIGRG